MPAVLKPRHGNLSNCLGAWYQPLLDTRRSSGSGPGPDTFKQLAARDGYLTCFTTMDVPAHAVVVAFLFLWECRLLLCCCIAQLLSWLVICVSRVTCDFVSRMGGRDTNNLFKGRLIETSLGGLHFCGSGAQNLDMETFTTVLAHGTSLSSAHVVFWGQAPVRTPPSKWLHEMAT